jgi:hypothetical protein
MIMSMGAAKYLHSFLSTHPVGRLNTLLGASPVSRAKGGE